MFAMKPDGFDFAPSREPLELEALARKLTQAKGKDPLLKALKVRRSLSINQWWVREHSHGAAPHLR